MDDRWQPRKCGPAWKPAAAAATGTAAQGPPQESMNPMINPNHNSHSDVLQGQCSSTHKMMAEPLLPLTSNFTSYNSGHSVLGSSFLSLLSGPPSSLQCDSQQVLSSKPFNSSSKVPLCGSSFTVGPTGHEASFTPGPSPQNIGNCYLKPRVDSCPVLPTRTMTSVGGSPASCLPDPVQARKGNDPSLDPAKVVNSHTSFGIERLSGVSSLKAAPIPSSTPVQSGKLHSTSSQAFPQLLQTWSPVPHQLSPLASGFPRVFCLYASGDLLLSNAGLLGVVCSCHGLHMSVSKFSEHSGLQDVNPGDAVHMESGETVAQWRKVYFRKFGIRIPEDGCGWDWPEGSSAAGDLLKSRDRVPNMSGITNLSNATGPSKAFVLSRQSLDKVLFSNPHTGQKLVDENPCAERERDAHNFSKSLNGFIKASQSNLHTGVANKTVELPVSGCLSMSKLACGSKNDFLSNSTYIDPISKTKNPLNSLKNMQRLRTHSEDSDNFGLNSTRDSDVPGKATVSSNIELRLGQPSQKSQKLGKSNVPGFNTHMVSRPDRPLEVISVDWKFPNVGSSRIAEETRPYVDCAAQAARSSSTIEQNFKFANLGFGNYGTRNALQSEQFKGDLVAGSINSVFFSHLESPKGKMQCKGSQNVANDSCAMPKQQIVESRIPKSNPMSLGHYKDDTTEIHSSVNGLGNYKLMDRDKGFGHAAVSEHVQAEMDLGCHMNFMGSLRSSSGFNQTSCNKNPHSHKLSSISAVGSDRRLIFNSPEIISSSGGSEHPAYGYVRPVAPQSVASRPPLPSQARSTVFPSLIENHTQVTSTLSKEEFKRGNPYLADRSSGMLSFKQAMEFSNQDNVSSSCGFNKDQKMSVNYLSENVKSSIALPLKSAEMRDDCNFASKVKPPEHAMKSVHSGITYCTIRGTEKSASIAEASWGTSSQTRDIGVQPVFCNPLLTGPSPPRVGQSDENICSPSAHRKKCQITSYIPDKFSSSLQKNSLDGSCNLEGKNPLVAFEEQLQIKASMVSPSNLDKDCTLLGNKSISSSKFGELLKPNLKKVECNAFQWKDVPSKITGKESVPCKNQLDGKTVIEDQTSDVGPKCLNPSVQKDDCMKDQVLSTISSKCSAPAVTQASVRVSNGDSCTDDAQNTGCAKNFAVDEGSGIEKGWSSDDAFDSGSNNNFDGFACKTNLKNDALSKASLDRSARSLIDELRVINSLRLKKVPSQVHTGSSFNDKTNSMQKFQNEFEAVKKKRELKCKVPDSSFFPASPVSSKSTGSSEQSSQSLDDLQMIFQPNHEKSHNCTCSVGPRFKRKRSTLPASLLTACCKHDVNRFDKSTVVLSCQEPRGAYDDYLEITDASCGKKFRLDHTSSKTREVWKQKVHHTDVQLTRECNSVSRRIVTSSQKVNFCKGSIRPVVCGRYGLISNGDTSKPAKIFSLKKIFQTARRCAPAGDKVLKKSSAKALKKATIREGSRRSARISNLKKDKESIGGTTVFSDFEPTNTQGETERACTPGWTKDTELSYMLEGGKYSMSRNTPDCDPSTRLRRKNKEIRKRSLYELITKGKDSTSASFSKERAGVPENHFKNGEDSDNLVLDNPSVSLENKNKSTQDVNMFCHVCRSSNNEEMNCLLKCNRCLIRVHQACYGISKVPKSYWYCRPCKENATNIVCVLCGYEGGAMTRAVHSSDTVKSLLNAWHVVIENPAMPSKVLEEQLNVNSPFGPHIDIDASPNTSPECMKSSSADLMVKKYSSTLNDTLVLNSITAGLFDSTVKQWVHMVCGLWTQGTRCPNVDTMSAFDVSGASHPKADVVCAMCKRPGGCCIRCRVMDCAIQFHPWCAHLKGLLQSETEGADNEKVGFYGRCDIHATEDHCEHTNAGSLRSNRANEKETCARTEGYKGRKREGFRHDIRRISSGSGGCLVPQEQVDAWNYINRQLSSRKRLRTQPLHAVQDKEYDCRKEYAHYKQSKGWKHLIVYKSGIHALGLYTSWFISQGAMVVEYVGEIVGLRVADRRESEYQSGKKLQYKSACYFFRIDKEHIIDATRKGGIARFVNHSCQPNCVAKVITVRGEKKVVFFAERDIYPGEEITYDYHFNNEDEGKKILCSCNSKNCRRYLN